MAGESRAGAHRHASTAASPQHRETSSDTHATAEAHGAGEGLQGEGELRAAPLLIGTPEQQAALADLSNGWTRERVLAAVAVTGSIGGAADVAGVSARTIHYWQDRDPEFKLQVEAARRRAGERVLTHLVTSAMSASQEQTVRTPTAAIAAINMLLPELRPNGVQVNVDARQQTVNNLSAETIEALRAALQLTRPDEPAT